MCLCVRSGPRGSADASAPAVYAVPMATGKQSAKVRGVFVDDDTVVFVNAAGAPEGKWP